MAENSYRSLDKWLREISDKEIFSVSDTIENRRLFAVFIARQIREIGEIPHFTREAVVEVIEELRRWSGMKHRFALDFERTKKLIEDSGKLALAEHAPFVLPIHVRKAAKSTRRPSTSDSY